MTDEQQSVPDPDATPDAHADETVPASPEVTTQAPGAESDDDAGGDTEPASLLPAIVTSATLIVIMGILAIQTPMVDARFHGEGDLNPRLIRWIGFVMYANLCALLASVLLPVGGLAHGVWRKFRGGAFRASMIALYVLPLICFLAYHVLSQSWLWRIVRLITASG